MSAESPFVVARARVTAVERVSPTFARVTFGGDDLADFGTPGAVLDQRIKLIFPGPSGVVPHLATGDDWYSAWLAIPEGERGSMRTYSIRDLQIEDDRTSVVVDFVLHLEPGLTGPAATWASTASVGDELLVIGPRRGGTGGGGIEYAPVDGATILLAGDETAAPAIARILEDAAPEVRGTAFVEVPHADDILPIAAPPGVAVHWLPRSGRAHGEMLIPTVLEHLGDAVSAVEIRDVDTDELLWETPQYSGLGEELPASTPHADRYFWIAGESGVVTTLRRHLVKDLGIDRSQVAFMGYWRAGVAMRG
jgi:NADPH-dependent ferric siderophore reductase